MQAYLKLKETNEELYEVNFNLEKITCNFFKKIIPFLVYTYLRFVVNIKKWLNIITVKEIYTGLIFIFPISKMEESLNMHSKKNIKKYNNKLKNCIKKAKKLISKYQVSTLVLSEELRKNEAFLNICDKNGNLNKEIQILDGKKMMQYLIKESIEYILKKNNKTTELEDLYILVNKDNSYYKENISYLSQYFKTVNIVTPCISEYQKFANRLEEKYNAILTVTNNKRKSLRKAKWIVNFDLSSEEIKKYTIYRTATIIYLEKDGIYQEGTFDGLHICQAGIDVSKEVKNLFIKQYLLKQCPITILYESTITGKKNFWNIKKQMQKDQVRIEKLYGSRGILADEEYKKVG